MTTHRATRSEKALLSEPLPPAQGIAGKGPTTPAVSASVIFKLLAFTAAMIIAPIGTYYGTMATIFRDRGQCGPGWAYTFSGNKTLAGACAAAAANVVLVAYIIVAIKEDEGEEEQRKEIELKKRS